MQCMHQDRNLGMGMKEVDGDLAAFIEMRKHEKENNSFDGIYDSTASNPDCSVISDAMFTDTLFKMTPADNFLDAEIPKSDLDWLLTPPHTPSIPPSKMPLQSANSQIATSKANASQPENSTDAPPSSNDLSASTSDTVTSSVSRIRKPLSSSARQKSTASRSATPTGNSSTLPSKTRSSTPTSRGTNAASSKPVAHVARSSTPIRVAPRSATPPARSSTPSTAKSAPRSSTPTLRSSGSSNPKTVPAMSKNTAPRVGIVPMVKSRPKPVSNTPVNQSDAPKRPSSASRGRPSPERGQVKSAPLDTGRSALSRSRGYVNGSDDVNPVLMGTKMVERVVNMRKLAPPKQDRDDSHVNSSGKSSSHDNSGFGRSLSKKSLDMAIRHMDIRRSISGNLKKIVTSISAGSSKASTTTSASDSPLATSSNTSSES